MSLQRGVRGVCAVTLAKIWSGVSISPNYATAFGTNVRRNPNIAGTHQSVMEAFHFLPDRSKQPINNSRIGPGGNVRKASTILVFGIGLFFAGFGAVNACTHTYQVRTIEANRQRYGALEDVILEEKNASFRAGDDALVATRNHDLIAFGLAVETKAEHLKNAFNAQRSLGTGSSSAEAERLLEILPKHKVDDLNVAVGMTFLGVWLAITLSDACSSLDMSPVYLDNDEAWLRLLDLDIQQWERQMGGPSRNLPYHKDPTH